MKIMLACGGTGGHLFPGIALAQAFQKRRPETEIVFVGTKRGIEDEVLRESLWQLRLIKISSFADRGLWQKFLFFFSLARGVFSALRILREEKPDVIVGVGGYVQAPVILAAFLLRKPILMIEPNAVPGYSNRYLQFFADRVVVAYPAMEKYFGKKALELGVPLRADIFEETRKTFPPTSKACILIFGGSLGAKKINETVLSALPHLTALKDKIHFIHQVGRDANTEAMKKAYQDLGFSAEVLPFIHDMGGMYRRARLVIARAGANTVAELAAFGKPAILIPYPSAQKNHQEANARVLESVGGVRCVTQPELTAARLAREIRSLLENPDLLKKMSINLKRLERKDAADKVAQLCLNRYNISTL